MGQYGGVCQHSARHERCLVLDDLRKSSACARRGGVPGRYLQVQRGGGGQIERQGSGHAGRPPGRGGAAQQWHGAAHRAASPPRHEPAQEIGSSEQVCGNAQAASESEEILISSREGRLSGVPRSTRKPVQPCSSLVVKHARAVCISSKKERTLLI